VSFAAITLCVASQRVFIVVIVCFVMDSVRKLFDTPSYASPRGVQSPISHFHASIYLKKHFVGAVLVRLCGSFERKATPVYINHGKKNVECHNILITDDSKVKSRDSSV
jgi:hypothetical protein